MPRHEFYASIEGYRKISDARKRRTDRHGHRAEIARRVWGSLQWQRSIVKPSILIQRHLLEARSLSWSLAHFVPSINSPAEITVEETS
jgi:hypothetical protein